MRDIDDVPTLAASADDNALERLKEHIQRFVSTDDIAAIMAEQPSRARNELKARAVRRSRTLPGRASPSASSSG